MMMIDYSELGVGMVTEGMEVRSVGNTLILHETALVEAFNLKASIEYNLKNCKFQQLLCFCSDNCIFSWFLPSPMNVS